MSQRFQIQDHIAQDDSGVLFHAIDTESGRAVCLQRFFPFGLEGGGLAEHEREEYQRGVAGLTALSYPALRAVLGGGCDPVDGIPYLVTEWIDGEALESVLDRGVFEPAAAAALLDRALQLCQAISAQLGVEAMWLEMAPAQVILDGANQGRGFTFGVSPVRWLVASQERGSLMPLVTLAENLLGWQGRLVGDQAGGGLGGWLKWLRDMAATVSLAEARRRLAICMEWEVAVSVVPAGVRSAVVIARSGAVTQPLEQPGVITAPMVAAAYESTAGGHKLQGLWIGVLLLLIGLAGWWVLTHPRGDTAATAVAAAVAPQDAESRRVAEVNARATELMRAAAAESPAPSEPTQVFQTADSKALLNEKGKEVTVEGVLKKLRLTKATLFLEFSEAPEAALVRGYVILKDAAADLSEESLKGLIGKRVRLTGVVRVVAPAKVKRPEVLLKDRKSIQEVP